MTKRAVGFCGSLLAIACSTFALAADPMIEVDHAATLLAPDPASQDHFGVSVSVSGDVAVIGAIGDDDFGPRSGSAYVFVRGGVEPGGWKFRRKLIAPDGAAGHEFGGAVSVSGDVLVCAARFDDDAGPRSGSVYLFMRHHGGLDNWGFLKKLIAPDGATEDEFGVSVSASGEIIVVGTHLDDDAGLASGSVYVFRRDEGGEENWGLVRKIVAPDGAAGDQFGFSVSASTNEVAVGAPSDDDAGSGSGAAYLFARCAGGENAWGLSKKLVIPGSEANDEIGRAVALCGDVAVVGGYLVGGPFSGSRSSAHVIERHAGGPENWGWVKRLQSPKIALGSGFGSAVGVSGHIAIVGSFRDGSSAGNRTGSAHIFARDAEGDGSWGLAQVTVAPDGAADDFFGAAVSISGAFVIVGAPYDDDVRANRGSAHVFTLACAADLNLDSRIDSADLGGLLGSFGSSGAPGEVYGDVNQDGIVNTADLGLLLGQFGVVCP